MKYFATLLFSFVCFSVFGQNPIIPAGMYMADPSAHVWKDGKLYLYVSVDESTEYYCSYKHHVLSTSDMVNWDITKDVFASKGENDQVPYSDKLLFAPDCAYKNGKYYLYYCQPDRKAAEGVAVGDSPVGPFVNGKKMELNGIEEIDPSVFIDDDGQAYYMWGQFKVKIAKLKPNMMEIDTSTIITDLITEEEHFFHEGGFMTKRKGIYYFIYADMSRANRPTSIGYATSNSPMGPFKYGGVIVDNNYCDPISWNNHGSIAEFNGQWYVFYHRASHKSYMMRRACVEPIYFNDDGSINEVEMTSQGAGPALNAFEKIEAERACLLFGNTRIELFEEGNEELAKIENDDVAAYKYINFKEGAEEISFRIKASGKDCVMSVHINQPWGVNLAWITIPENGDWQTVTSKIKTISGTHAVWLKFYGKEAEMELDWFKFN